jgi:hypothetical protein
MIDKAWEAGDFVQKSVIVTRIVRETKTKRCYAIEVETSIRGRRGWSDSETYYDRTLFWCAADEEAPAQAFLNRRNPGWALDALTGE